MSDEQEQTDRVYAPNVTQGRQEVGRGNPEAGGVKAPEFYGTGAHDLRAGTGKPDQDGEPRDTHGGLVGSEGLPMHDSRADPRPSE
jgi:hypothetical protein